MVLHYNEFGPIRDIERDKYKYWPKDHFVLQSLKPFPQSCNLLYAGMVFDPIQHIT